MGYSVSLVAVTKIEHDYAMSASGGVFPSLARHIWSNGGRVCGSVYKDGRIRHILSGDPSDLPMMQGSKYVESSYGEIIPEIARCLEQEIDVLFVGTPCQVSTLRAKFGKNKHLLLVDLVCHGAPSWDVFERYLELRGFKPEEIAHVTFRSKNKHQKSNYDIVLHIGGRPYVSSEMKDIYSVAYRNGWIMKRRCYECRFASRERCGDLTIGDCATFRDYSHLAQGRALSIILVNTDRGLRSWSAIEGYFDFATLDLNKEVLSNRPLRTPLVKPPIREKFLHDLSNLQLRQLQKKYVPFKPNEFVRHLIKGLISAKTRDAFISWRRKRGL